MCNLDHKNLNSYYPVYNTSQMMKKGGWGTDGRFYPWPSELHLVCKKCGFTIKDKNKFPSYTKSI